MSVGLPAESEHSHGKGRKQNRVFAMVLDGAIRRVKVCRRCGRTKVAEENAPDRGFDVQQRSKGVVVFAPLCKPCRRQARKDRLRDDPEYAEQVRRANTEARRRWLEDPVNLEKARRSYRAYYYRQMEKDPEGIAEAARMSYRLRQERKGRPVKPAGKNWVDVSQPRIPAAPFYRWVLAYFQLRNTTVVAVAEELGLTERRLRSILGQEYDRVSADLVDRALQNSRVDVWVEGRRVFGLADLYPSVYG